MKDEKETKISGLLMQNYEKYYRIAYSYVHNEADAQDIVQESAYKAICQSNKLKKVEYADTWICRILMNEAISFIRKNHRNNAQLEEMQGGSEDRYEDLDLKKALETLEVKEKTIIVLRFFEEMSLKQIAQVLNENTNTVKSRLYRTLAKLKLSLDE
ncbi:MAG: sigma-70 family RNA polymerase sigma factor [Clostridiales bacterium]|nr:sigma-70 family RNA polymerase sigma factor [Clostridiales bacterium]